MEKTFKYNELPQNVEELKKLSNLSDEYEVAALVVLALCHYEQNVDETIAMINYLKGPVEMNNMDKQFLRDRLAGKKYLMRSYLAGTSVENNYQPRIPYEITVRDNSYSYSQDGYVTLYITSSGADSDRSVQLRKKDNQYFLWQNNLMVGIRIPQQDDPWK
ncbi:MAG: hypothetical protein Q4C64_00240 [Erysipelotrichia bacterium]|nr:hypothetical protein [Erysipelotrichia bacterium]